MINKDEKENVLNHLRKDGNYLMRLENHWLDDEDVVLTAVKQYYYAIEYASDRLKSDLDFMLRACQENGGVLKYASPSIRDNKEIVLQGMKTNGRALKYVSTRMKQDEDIVLAAVTQNGAMLEHVEPFFTDNKKVVGAAVKNRAGSLLYASEKLKDDEEVVLAAFSSGQDAMNHASQRIKNKLCQDKSFICKVLEVNPFMLANVEKHYKDDEEIVFVAVSKVKDTIIWASPRIRDMCLYNNPQKVLASFLLHRELQNTIAEKPLNPKKKL